MHQIILFDLEKIFLTYNKIMTINNQIRDEKLRLSINREAAKISALTSDKFDKYEYLTGEEILPSKEEQITEQAKITYSPLRKAFEKQIKTIEDQGKKQIKAIQDPRQVKTIRKYVYNSEDTRLILKRKKIFNELANKRHGEIEELDNMVKRDNLVYKYTDKETKRSV